MSHKSPNIGSLSQNMTCKIVSVMLQGYIGRMSGTPIAFYAEIARPVNTRRLYLGYKEPLFPSVWLSHSLYFSLTLTNFSQNYFFVYSWVSFF